MQSSRVKFWSQWHWCKTRILALVSSSLFCIYTDANGVTICLLVYKVPLQCTLTLLGCQLKTKMLMFKLYLQNRLEQALHLCIKSCVQIGTSCIHQSCLQKCSCVCMEVGSVSADTVCAKPLVWDLGIGLSSQDFTGFLQTCFVLTNITIVLFIPVLNFRCRSCDQCSKASYCGDWNDELAPAMNHR